MTREQPKNFEEELNRLEEIVQALESEEIDLERSLELFEEGIRLAGSAQKRLEQTELRIKKLMGELEEEIRVEDLLEEE